MDTQHPDNQQDKTQATTPKKPPVNWQRGLAKRGILEAAKLMGWRYREILGHHGWQYPLHNLSGHNKGMRWKNMNSKAQPKYIWMDNKAADAPEYYFMPGLQSAVVETDGTLYLANGEPAALSLWSADIHNVICWLNGETAVPDSLLRLLEHLGVKRIIHFFDKDQTGREAVRQICSQLYDVDVAYHAMHLPDKIHKKGDLNDWWCLTNFDKETFRAEFFARCDDPDALYLYQPPNTPAPPEVPFTDLPYNDVPEQERSRGERDPRELPEAYFEAIVAGLQSHQPIRIKHDGHTSAVKCVFCTHEHDDTNPAGSWHTTKGYFHCFKCGQTWNAIQTGRAMGLDWRDFVEDWEDNYRDVPAPHATLEGTPLSDDEMMTLAFGEDDFDSGDDDFFGIDMDNPTTPPDMMMPDPFTPARKTDAPQYPFTVPPALQKVTYPALPYDFMRHCFDRGEDGDMLILRKLFRHRLLYDVSANCWYLWNGHHWQRDDLRQIRYLFTQHVADQYAGLAVEFMRRATYARNHDDYKKYKKLSRMTERRVRKLRNFAGMRSSLTMAEWTFTVYGDVWDKHGHLLGVQNGVMDLRTGTHRAGRPGDYIRSVATTAYNPGATAPTFEKFVHDIFDGDSEMVAFVQRLLGYCITGSTRDHVIPIFHGRGRNGKDTLLETITTVMGDTLASPGDEALVTGGKRRHGGPTPELYGLMGKRLTWVSETAEEAVINASRMKLISGGGRITARELYGNPVTFEPTHKVIIQTNHKPVAPARDEDYALWERLLLIPFELSFVDNPEEDYERQRDDRLKGKLKQESEGILNWLLAGALDWHQNGLNPPEKVRAATHQYAEEEDIVGRFVDEMCDTTDDDATVQALTAYEAYLAWAERVKEARILSNKMFGIRLTKLFSKRHTEKGKIYRGLRLINGTIPAPPTTS